MTNLFPRALPHIFTQTLSIHPYALFSCCVVGDQISKSLILGVKELRDFIGESIAEHAKNLDKDDPKVIGCFLYIRRMFFPNK